jgi:hypothetical protein
MDQAHLSNASDINKLARALATLKDVNRFDTSDEVEGGTLAHTFSDLENSFRKFLFKLLPRLTTENLSEAEAIEILSAIGDEFRHINYHLCDTKFYEYLWGDSA